MYCFSGVNTMMVKSYSYVSKGVLNLQEQLILSILLLMIYLDQSNSFKIQDHNGKPYIFNETLLPTSYNFYSYNATSDLRDSNSGTGVIPMQPRNETWVWGWNSKEQKFNLNVTSSLGSLELQTATVRGLRIEESSKPVSYEKGVSVIVADSPAVIRLFGDRFTKHTIIRFVSEMRLRGEDCDDLTSTKSFALYKKEITDHSALATIQLPPLDLGETEFYICVRQNNTDMPWVHQGTEQWIVLKTYQKWLPMWVHIILLVLLLLFSGLFSGLNLGLMAIDRTELKIIGNTGSEKERRYAKKIQPLRDNGNYLLCSLLLGNVMVNSTLTILLDDLTSGLIAVIGSTLGIVIFGEILPQAFCSRYGLAVGARTVWITKLTMAATFPLSYPVSVLLDKILGEEIGNVYNRDRLKELIKVTQSYNDLENDEVNVIEGVLKLSQSTCADVMTKLDDVYMLPLSVCVDFDTISEIMSSGYSRIPIYEGARGNVVSILYTKDLAFVDPDDKMPLRTLCEFYNNPCNFVEDIKPLDAMFKEFKQGNKGHMAFVQRIHTSDFSDPFYEIIGIITLEDVIEELIQAEINDETDVLASNRSRRRSRGPINIMQGMARTKSDGTNVSPQLALAAYQYLSTSIDEFNSDRISKNILERLLQQNVFIRIKYKAREDQKIDQATVIYERGKAADYFVLILEGRVHAEMGKENLVFESGPFTYFGTQSLALAVGIGEAPSTPVESRKFGSSSGNLESMLHTMFIPDYTVRAVTDVTYLRIQKSIYTAAKQATLLERSYSQADSNAMTKAGDNFDEQIIQMMNGLQNTNDNENNGQDQNSLLGGAGLKDNEKHRGNLGEIILAPSFLLSRSGKTDPSTKTRHNDSELSEAKNSKTYAAMKLLDTYGQKNSLKPQTTIIDTENEESEHIHKL